MPDKYRMSIVATGKASKTQPPRDCVQCGAPLSRYRNATETECAFHPKIVLPKGSYGMAQYKAAHRAGKAALEELGYHEVGFDSNAHLVMEHPYAGRLYVAGTPADIDGEVRYKVKKAERQLRTINSHVAEFVEHLRHKYMVATHVSVVVQTTMQKEIRQWAANRPPGAERININTFAAPVMKGGYVRMLKAGQGRNLSTIEIFGSEYIPPDDKVEPPSNADIKIQKEVADKAETHNEPICGAQHPHFPAVWCTLPPDHDDMHGSEAVESGWWTTEDVKNFPDKPELRVPYYHKGAQDMEPIKAKVEAPISAHKPATPPVGVSTPEPQVAIDTSSKPDDKTPQGAAVILTPEQAEVLRSILAPNAYTNEQVIAQCKDTVKDLHKTLDSAYEMLYNLERILGL